MLNSAGKQSEIIRYTMFLLSIIAIAIYTGFITHVLPPINVFSLNSFYDLLVELYYFPLGVLEALNISFLGLSNMYYGFLLFLWISGGGLLVASAGWFIYYRIIRFGTKIKSNYVFVIFYIIFILLLLGNMAGCTAQHSFLKTIN